MAADLSAVVDTLLKSLSFDIRNQIQHIDAEIAAANTIGQALNQESEFAVENWNAKDLLRVLLASRICNRPWIDSKPPLRWLISHVQLMRILFRDRSLQDQFFTWRLLPEFIHFGDWTTQTYLAHDCSADYTPIVRGFLSVAQKLCNSPDHANFLSHNGFHKTIITLLPAKDMVVLQATLQVLAMLCEHSEIARADVCSSNALDQALQLLKDSDLLTQKLATSLLRILCCEIEGREQIKVYDGVPVLLSLLSTRNVRLQWHVSWTLAQLTEEQETAAEVGQLGAVPLILSELGNNKIPVNSVDDWLTMLTGLCAVLSQLCQVDANAILIVQDNGIYVLCKLLLIQLNQNELRDNHNYHLLQCSLFRVLRLLFSLERNRHFFKRLFPPTFFSMFIDIGHYVQELTAYDQLVVSFRSILTTDGAEVKSAIEAVNQVRAPLNFIGQYAVLEQLGAGAFGCVYRVRKNVGASASEQLHLQQYALKEIFMHQSTAERETSGTDKSFGDIISEVKIIKQQLRHPNVVRYRRVFVENDKLYIVMDLIDGASLKEHINSVKEKATNFPEDRLWNIVIQMVLALRYLHKDKRIVHRDLKPNNIMLTDNDRVVITDFGLAKERGESYLKSAAGTILYSCPEIVQNQPYGDKADVWSLGCCVYEMCALSPPFYSQNMLLLATTIVEGKYEPLNTALYSPELIGLVGKCLTANNDHRPDIVGVAQMMTVKLMLCIDDVIRQQYSQLQKKIARQNNANGDYRFSGSRSSGETTSQSLGSSLTLSDSVGSSVVSQLQMRAVSRAKVSPTQLNNRKNPIRALKVSVDVTSKQEQQPKKATKALSAKVVPVGGRAARALSEDRRHRRTASASGLPVILPNKSSQQQQRKSAWSNNEPPGESLFLPTIRRVNSSSSVESQRRNNQMRMSSASSLVSIATEKLKPITDPILELLGVLHSVMYISQLPHEGLINHKRRVIDQFRRRLFSKESDGMKIKAELRKLSAQSQDPVAVNLGYADFRPVLDGVDVVDLEEGARVEHLTYEQLYACMHIVLAENDALHMRELRPPSRLATSFGRTSVTS